MDDDELTRLFMRGFAQKLRLRIIEAADGFEALEKVNASVQVALIDLQMPRMGGMELIPELRKRFPSLRFIVVSGTGDLDDAVAVMKLGACDYLQKSVDFTSLAESLLRYFSPELPPSGTHFIAGRKVGVTSAEAAPILSGSWHAGLLRIAALDANVLLTGETGTGKSMAAKFIHDNSPRAAKPLVSVNCASLPRDLIECELFGHKKGSFTGAVEDRAGRAELADGGTLFLDEIGDLPLELQPKLLTFLQDRTAFRIGSNIPYEVDCRVIAATHRDLLLLCREKLFREDLFFRLDVFSVKLPPLRERKQEIVSIVESSLRHPCPTGRRQSDRRSALLHSQRGPDWQRLRTSRTATLVNRKQLPLATGRLVPRRRQSRSRANPDQQSFVDAASRHQPLKASSLHRQPERKEAKRRMERSLPRRCTANSAVKLRAPSASSGVPAGKLRLVQSSRASFTNLRLCFSNFWYSFLSRRL